MPHKLRFENFYKTLLTTPITEASGDIIIKVAQPPVNQMGFLILSPENVVQREICFYHSVSGNDISVRGVNRKNPKTHAAQESIKINDVAEIFDFMNENISTTFYCEKIGNLSVKMWGGYVAYNGAPQIVADTEFTFGANSINYLVYDYYGNVLTNSATDTGNVRAVVTCSGGVISSIEYRHSKDSMIDKNIARETTILTLTLLNTAVVAGETFQSAFGKLQGQINAIISSMYTKTEVDAIANLKADKATTYLKTEVDAIANLKADKATTYLKTEVDAIANLKADKATTYLKTEVDAALNLKADQATTYTKSAVDIFLANKANAANVYSTIQVDNLVAQRMLTSVYDADATGVVDNSQRLNGQYASFYVSQTDLANAIFNTGAADMRKADNLVGLFDYTAARSNLSVYSITQVNSLLAGKTSAGDVATIIGASTLFYTKAESDAITGSKANDTSVVHRTGGVAETITGVKTFGSMPIFSAGGQIAMNTGHYIFDAPIANQARIWSSNASAGLWIGAFTGGISLNNTVYVTEGNRLEVGSNNTSNYTRLLVLGNSDTTRMIEWGDGGVVWAGFGRTTTNEQYMDVSNYGGKDFEMRGKYWFRRGLHSTQITDADSRQVRIGSRWDISNIAHSATGHILQFLWGDNASAAEGSGTDGGWGLEFGAHGNPYMKMIATDTTIGRTDGYVSVFGSGFHVANGNVLRVYQAASSNHLAIWNNGTYNRLEAVGGQAINIVGTGKLLVIGDDCALHDVNQANTLMLAGEQNSAVGILKLGTGGAAVQGNADGSLTLVGYRGSGVTSGASAAVRLSMTGGTTVYSTSTDLGTNGGIYSVSTYSTYNYSYWLYVQVSDDNSNWTTVVNGLAFLDSLTGGVGGLSFDTTVTVNKRYVRHGTQYGTSSYTLLSTGMATKY